MKEDNGREIGESPFGEQVESKRETEAQRKTEYVFCLLWCSAA